MSRAPLRNTSHTYEQAVAPAASPHPLVTGYRLLVTGVALTSGMGKAIPSYLNVPTVPSALGWTSGVVVTTT